MNVYRRYFKATSGPMIDKIKESQSINIEANKKFSEILQELGACNEYYHREGKLIAMKFPGNVDQNKYKKMSCGGWYPKRNTKYGRELHKRIDLVATSPETNSLSSIGLTTSPTIFSAGRCYFPSMTKIPSDPMVVFVSVPWYDEDPEAVELYKIDRELGRRGDGNIDAILWQPSDELVEIKEWEVTKAIEEWNQSLKSSAKARGEQNV